MLESFDQISLAKQLNGYSMRWYLFFVRVLSILWLILGPILFLSTMNQDVFDIYHGSYQNYFNNSLIGPYNSIVMILFWVGEVILLMSRSELKKLSFLGCPDHYLFLNKPGKFALYIADLFSIFTRINNWVCFRVNNIAYSQPGLFH